MTGFSTIELLTAYGYSLSIFVPISFLWVVPVEFIRWGLVIVGAVVSGKEEIIFIGTSIFRIDFLFNLGKNCACYAILKLQKKMWVQNVFTWGKIIGYKFILEEITLM
jgi:hypothetical protein